MPHVNGTRVASTPALVEEFLDYLADDLNYPASTVSTYSRCYAALVDFCAEEGVHLLEVEDDLLRKFFKARGKTLATRSRNKMVYELRSLYNWLHDVKRLAPFNYAKSLPIGKTPKSDPHPMPDELWSRLWSMPLSDADRVAFGLSFFCGLRREEVCRITPLQMQVALGVTGDMWRKGGEIVTFQFLDCLTLFGEQRPDLGSDRLMPALKRLLVEREGKRTLFGGWMRAEDTPWVNPTNYNKRIYAVQRKMKLPVGTIKPHDFRHAFCTNLAKLDVDLLDIASMANHKSTNTTTIYIELAKSPLKKYLGKEPTEKASKGLVRPRY